jgi:uncharacterized protein YbbC (DUF1343 family)
MVVPMRLKILIIGVLLVSAVLGQVQFSTQVKTGADQTETYVPYLAGKRVAIVGNQSSQIKGSHLVDTLLNSGISIVKVFCPEHGFRGTADAGETINDGIDEISGLPLISLYGKHKKPSKADMQNVDMVVFDIQDVGVRFYTYISTLHYVMEACAENYIPLLVLDRPNPNGFYVDGPVLDTAARSFVGMHPVPLVHGMTIGEYALMINGQKWLEDELQCNLSVIPCKNYDHSILYELPVNPSPNLPNSTSVLLYPSLGLFEGTVVSVGRGTGFPFQVFGHPDYKKGKFEFTPESKPGAKQPKFKGVICKGENLQNYSIQELRDEKRIDLSYLLTAYKGLERKTDFFNSYFYRLAGSSILQKQIEQGLSEEEIRTSWQQDLTVFKKIRSKYLLYQD